MINADVMKVLEAVPVFQSPTGIRYVRASDLPDTARPEFERWAVDVKSPDIRGELPGDPIREDDYAAWLSVLRP